MPTYDQNVSRLFMRKITVIVQFVLAIWIVLAVIAVFSFFIILSNKGRTSALNIRITPKLTHLVKIIKQTKKIYKRDRKLILLWSDSSTKFDVQHILDSTRCSSLKHCDLSTNKDRLSQANAVYIEWKSIKRSLPLFHQHPNQPYLILGLKDPLPSNKNHTELLQMKNIFNLSMSYWGDSDIQHRSGVIRPNQNYFPHFRGSKYDPRKSLAYCYPQDVGSNSILKAFVNSMKKYGKMDELMPCPSAAMPSYSNKELFYEEISKTYKFFFALENELCQDYIPESVFYVLKNSMVPVFFSNSNLGGLMPPNSFINASRFSSVEQLANFIQRLHTNSEMYSKFFEWKRFYEVEIPSFQGFCDLCEKLTDDVKISISNKQFKDPVDFVLSKFPQCKNISNLFGMSFSHTVVDGSDAEEF